MLCHIFLNEEKGINFTKKQIYFRDFKGKWEAKRNNY